MGDLIYVVDCFTYDGSEWQEIFTDTDELVEYIEEARKSYYSAGFHFQVSMWKRATDPPSESFCGSAAFPVYP